MILSVKYTLSSSQTSNIYIKASSGANGNKACLGTNWYAGGCYTTGTFSGTTHTDTTTFTGQKYIIVGVSRAINGRQWMARVEIGGKLVKETGWYESDQPNDECVLIPLDSFKSDTPTYLETLDKLDQWSSAQYIPDKSRDELNF